MVKVQGKYNRAIVFTENVDPGAIEQIKILCDQEFVQGSKIRIMPDVHVGMGCTIGTTMTIEDKIVPNLVGVDIGCGLEVVKLANRNLNLQALDDLIYTRIPSGFKVRSREHSFNEMVDLGQLVCRNKVNLSRARLSIGTLGGGNHFIEVNRDSEDNLYLVVHSGSRHLGLEVANLYQREAQRTSRDIPKALAYVEGQFFDDYLHDMQIVQHYAGVNRQAMIHEIVQGLDLKVIEQFTTIHNYIDTERMILRKGAVSAEKGEKLIVPINMRDGSLLCVGQGNSEWNYSAPHGAGRIMSRTEARRSLVLAEYKELMQDVYSTSVSRATLDECPLAYRPLEEIVENMGETAKIIDRIVPVYNFKAKD